VSDNPDIVPVRARIVKESILHLRHHARDLRDRGVVDRADDAAAVANELDRVLRFTNPPWSIIQKILNPPAKGDDPMT
jgi:hypothetical protein